ncbi:MULTISPECIES: cobalamin-dependent protein [Streptomyces]|uniref:Methylaspartate mutase subunit S n=1 Tax=Streptomyces albus (strain ATCC 21838 / DSM 41398 / FERM P-419 / JCM 4703 / NBRC 107858) TaxID=1081613 RepID=A0A0B5EGM9_STRA4|nr:cobalamin-dependent protein [Streptomyces sp. SCSIO ZS0520]AJE81298.1 methylaspartate mutase subunit S [Streptomyces albus]AOU75613.1 methylaspartate mutase subunit S [Streptomyces albus]AYN31417.1 methylaspartate mutase [Streptomyces albus]
MPYESGPQSAGSAEPRTRTVILGVAASDSHVVANHLIAHALRAQGFHVVNLGTCTTVGEFAEAHAEHPWAEAVIIGSLNGHAYEDLQELPEARRAGQLACPVIVGGNLSVGSHKDSNDIERLKGLGVDVVLFDPEELPATLDRLRTPVAEPLPAS